VDYGKLPLSFEVNSGQANRRVKFLARGSGYNLFLAPTEATLTFRRSSKNALTPTTRLRIQHVGANAEPEMSGREKLPGKVSYFIGNDPKQWRTDIPTYARLEYRDVYPGVDLIYHGAQGSLEYDFVVAPGADPSGIALAFHGAEKLEIDSEGNLLLRVAGGSLRQQKPHIYQEVDGVRRKIDGGYVFRSLSQRDSSHGARGIGFHVAAYDTSKPLIIDPVLSYSTYLGDIGFDEGRGIAVDSSGNAYITGTTAPLDDVDLTLADVFVIKLDSSGSTPLYAAFLGGTGSDQSSGIAVDTHGSAYITGRTGSANFPTTNAAYDTSCSNTPTGTGGASFMAKLDATGTALEYSTYLCGGFNFETSTTGVTEANAIAVDATGNAYVTGSTFSLHFPTTAGALQQAFGGSSDVFVAKFNPTGSALVYSTYLGGVGIDKGLGIALDTQGNVYVTGSTMAPSTTTANNFPTTPGAFQTTCNRSCNVAFITKVNTTGSGLVYSTLLGGTDGFTQALGIAVDSGGSAYVTGQTKASDFPLVNPLQVAEDRTTTTGAIFVTKVNPDGTNLIYSTFLRGDAGWSIAADTAGNAYVTGSTSSSDFPVVNPWQPQLGGNDDAFVTKINPAGSVVIYSTFLGGSTNDEGRSIAVDSSSSAYVTGFATSSDFPTLRPVQPLHAGGNPHFDAFVAKFTETTISADLTISHIGCPEVFVPNQPQTYRFLVTNLGPDNAEQVIVTDATSVISGAPVVSATSSQGTCSEVGGKITCELGTISNGATATVTFVINGGGIHTLANVNSAKADDPNRSNNTVLVSEVTAGDLQCTQLRVTKVGFGTGTVISNPAGINCGTACAKNYLLGTVVTLTATPDPGSTFTGWDGFTGSGVLPCSGTGSCTVSMTSAISVNARFTTVPTSPTLTPGQTTGAMAGPLSVAFSNGPGGCWVGLFPVATSGPNGYVDWQ